MKTRILSGVCRLSETGFEWRQGCFCSRRGGGTPVLPLRGVRILLRGVHFASDIASCMSIIVGAGDARRSRPRRFRRSWPEESPAGGREELALRERLYIISVTVYMHRITPCASWPPGNCRFSIWFKLIYKAKLNFQIQTGLYLNILKLINL